MSKPNVPTTPGEGFIAICPTIHTRVISDADGPVWLAAMLALRAQPMLSQSEKTYTFAKTGSAAAIPGLFSQDGDAFSFNGTLYVKNRGHVPAVAGLPS